MILYVNKYWAHLGRTHTKNDIKYECEHVYSALFNEINDECKMKDMITMYHTI